MNQKELRTFIDKLPIYQYSFIKPDDVEYSDKARQLCKRICPHYGTNWSCPPAVGKTEKCREKCLEYDSLLVFSTVTELVNDEASDRLSAHNGHSRLTKIIEDELEKGGADTYILESDHCIKCRRCTFPKDYCRHPDDLRPCIESHGIVVSELMDSCGMDYYLGGKLCLLFSLVYFKEGLSEGDRGGTQ